MGQAVRSDLARCAVQSHSSSGMGLTRTVVAEWRWIRAQKEAGMGILAVGMFLRVWASNEDEA